MVSKTKKKAQIAKEATKSSRKQPTISIFQQNLSYRKTFFLDLDETLVHCTTGMAVLDFDMLCSIVALQTANGTWGKLGGGDDDEHRGEEFGGVLRMWEGELLDYFDHRRIALESACCPYYRFGKNMKRADLGSCYIQAIVYSVVAICALFNFIAFIFTRHHYFLCLYIYYLLTLCYNVFKEDGHPPLGWNDTAAYLVLPILLIVSQYVSMEIMKPPAWIQSGTVRDNILFGKPMDKARYEKAIKACVLDKDINDFSHDYLTEIGQRGINSV